jgi:peptide/nickel transport system ATP-binding protein
MVENELLTVQNLSVDFCSEGRQRRVVNNVSYSLRRGETLGIVGESGSGKSVSSMAIVQLLPPAPQCCVEGHAMFFGGKNVADNSQPVDLLALSEKEMQNYRGNRISMVFQEPMTSLNPVQRCGHQVMEMLRQHEKINKAAAKQRVIKLFEEVKLPRPEKIFESYPYEISGGQKQRVMIAMALICNPDVLIADEPTTALDVTVQRAIIDLLKQLQQTHHIGIIFISHDLGVIGQIADNVAVMFHGEVVEQGPADEILHHPNHPYTQGLLACRPPLGDRPKHLPTVSDFMENSEMISPDIETQEERKERLASLYAQQPLMQVKDLEVTYALKKNFVGKVTQELKAVDKMTFDIYPGETLGLVGESGCGKTTLGRSLLRLIDAGTGTIMYRGKQLDALNDKQMRALRPQLQIIFQDPYSSLNPRITIGESIMEPLCSYNRYENDRQRREVVLELMQQVGLKADCYNRYPHEFSGGQRQRVCIARALVLHPELIICDESVSALDVSVQAQVLNLLNDLKRTYHFTYLFISHDLSVVRFLSDRIIVMEKGCMVEEGDADEIYAHPQRPYTQKLIAAIPKI